MARGITSFYEYGIVRHPGGGTFYTCPLCSFRVQRRMGNALAMAAKAKAAVRQHIIEKHKAPDEARLGLADHPATCAMCGRAVARHAPEEVNVCAAALAPAVSKS